MSIHPVSVRGPQYVGNHLCPRELPVAASWMEMVLRGKFRMACLESVSIKSGLQLGLQQPTATDSVVLPAGEAPDPMVDCKEHRLWGQTASLTTLAFSLTERLSANEPPCLFYFTSRMRIMPTFDPWAGTTGDIRHGPLLDIPVTINQFPIIYYFTYLLRYPGSLILFRFFLSLQHRGLRARSRGTPVASPQYCQR